MQGLTLTSSLALCFPSAQPLWPEDSALVLQSDQHGELPWAGGEGSCPPMPGAAPHGHPPPAVSSRGPGHPPLGSSAPSTSTQKWPFKWAGEVAGVPGPADWAPIGHQPQMSRGTVAKRPVPHKADLGDARIQGTWKGMSRSGGLRAPQPDTCHPPCPSESRTGARVPPPQARSCLLHPSCPPTCVPLYPGLTWVAETTATCTWTPMQTSLDTITPQAETGHPSSQQVCCRCRPTSPAPAPTWQGQPACPPQTDTTDAPSPGGTGQTAERGCLASPG